VEDVRTGRVNGRTIENGAGPKTVTKGFIKKNTISTVADGIQIDPL
jgi:hypothetical protein